ncbi:MAG: class I SAM-dependent methyltransferase, partial [Vicinamibacteria bacterium]
MPDASAIKEMFEDVAPRYDFLNRVLSLGIDRGWRRRVVECLELCP